MPAFKIPSRTTRLVNRTCSNIMAQVLPMNAHDLVKYIQMTETDENSDGSNVRKAKLLVLDCRSFLAYNSGHIMEAVNVNCPAILRRRSKDSVLPLKTLFPSPHIRTQMTCGHFTPIVLYDDSGQSPKHSCSDSQISTVQFVAKCLQINCGLKSVFYLEDGYQRFSHLFPELCASSATVSGSPTMCSSASSPAFNCPTQTWPSPRNSPRALKVYRDVNCSYHCRSDSSQDTGPVEILPHVWLGSAWDASKMDVLRKLGITALLNVSRSNTYPEFDSGYDDGRRLRYKNIPLKDSSSQLVECFFQEAFSFIEEERAVGGKVLVHCRAGVSRSATICIAYLMSSASLRMEEAYEHVRARRRLVCPNFNFMDQLMAYERKLFAEHVSSSPSDQTGTPNAVAPTYETLKDQNRVFSFDCVSPTEHL